MRLAGNFCTVIATNSNERVVTTSVTEDPSTSTWSKVSRRETNPVTLVEEHLSIEVEITHSSILQTFPFTLEVPEGKSKAGDLLFNFFQPPHLHVYGYS